ncbi:AFG1/ZapE family ATPase [Tumebacillus permanentifrigoris]|uniref:Replicative DNA helicase loader DnaI n=1 Tax=Tumebacillus permanentifrigoris TaxID=378543 RepID=A0A316D4E7_9BACL|nr:AFG1/ZapE family ATPase [Tumebacillus permanentifrigoris]PWK06295.1 replicative DNA helicase loader DnaI [Tumebacillus permanentifrigoris]
MDHIGSTLQFARQFQSRNQYTPEFFRDQVPQLRSMEVSEGAIQRGAILLLDQIKQERVCGACKGYEQCGKEGDAQGLYDYLEVYNDQLTIRTTHCPQYHNFVERRQIDSLNEYAQKSAADKRFRFDNFPSEQARKFPELYAAALEFADCYNPGRQELQRGIDLGGRGQTAADPFKGLYIFGPPGVGKTHIMLAICNRLDERKIPNIFVHADNIFDKLRTSIGAGKDMETIIEKYCTVPVLAIDEFAQERANEFTLDKMFRIINYRFSNNLPTLFTSNYEPPVVYQTFREQTRTVDALISRIIQMTRIGRLAGRDYRLTQMDILDASGR